MPRRSMRAPVAKNAPITGTGPGDPLAAGPTTAQDEGSQPTIVVGIGAAAGGLPPLRTILSGLPLGRGMAVVITQHVETGTEAPMVSLLADWAALKVVEATDGMFLTTDHVYVMPVARTLSLVDGKLSLGETAECQGLRMPIDHFFCTLAADQGRRTVGVLLSGSGTDGTHGLAEIKSLGGVTVVQHPDTADLPEMPRSAIERGVADVVSEPAKIATFLIQRAEELMALTSRQKEEAGIEEVLAAVRSFTGHDFHCYKRGTLERRIGRRMDLQRLSSSEDYARFVRTNKEEAAVLRKDLLIGVTEFFRQPEAWRALQTKVVNGLIDAAGPHATLRMWVPACASGKEAYSLAILLVESVESSGKKVGLQLFATDADAASVEVARAGQYAEDDLKGISPDRLERFFVRKNGRYEVVKQLREMIVFAPQDLTSDPPFSKLDLVSCRNLLIYLDQSVQKKIIQLFHFSLREGGCLFLGSAENVNGQDDLFEPLSPKWRIYRKLGVSTPVGLNLPLRPTIKPAIAVPALFTQVRPTLPAIAHLAIAERFGPPAAVVDRKGTLLYLYGHVEDYLQMPLGEQTGLLADAAREGLRNRLASAILQSTAENKKVTILARVKNERKSTPVKVTVSPVRRPREGEGLLLVTFEEEKQSRAAIAALRSEQPSSDRQQLEDELRVTREELSSTIEQLEQSNENLKASNEEVTSANEELQSANEELETSKEELQSLNEELNAVNQRLQDKVLELEQTGNDVANLLTSGDVATIFLDRQLRVRRFTPAVATLFSLVETDLGRPISDIHRKFHDDALLSEAKRVLVDLTPAVSEVRTEEGAWYIRRILPYRTRDDRIEGVAITFNDVTDLKLLADQNVLLANLLEQSDQPFAVSNPDGTLGVVNGAFERLTGYSRDELLGMDSTSGLTPEKWHNLENTKLAEIRRTGKPVRYEKEYVRKDGTIVPIELLVHLSADEQGKTRYYYSFLTDLTERKRVEVALQESEERFRLALKNSPVWVAVQDRNLVFRWAFNQRIRRADEIVGKTDADLFGPEEVPAILAAKRKLLESGTDVHLETWVTSNGAHLYLDFYFEPMRSSRGEIVGIGITAVDLTDLKQAEEALRETNEELMRFNRAAVDRELRMLELKKEINGLCSVVGEPLRYAIASGDEEP
jgi:two-component system, chemotaxis family, CheB/CheR fusion protein